MLETTMKLIKNFYYISCEIFWDNIINNQSNGGKKKRVEYHDQKSRWPQHSAT